MLSLEDNKEEVVKEDADGDETTVYELGFHLIPTLSGEEIGTEIHAMKSLIEKTGGVFIAEEFPKRISLAYPIAKKKNSKRENFDSAYFGWMKFEIAPQFITSFKEAVKEHDTILRFLILITTREQIPPQLKSLIFTKPAPQRHASFDVVPKKSVPASTRISDEELDKTIEELVTEK